MGTDFCVYRQWDLDFCDFCGMLYDFIWWSALLKRLCITTQGEISRRVARCWIALYHCSRDLIVFLLIPRGNNKRIQVVSMNKMKIFRNCRDEMFLNLKTAGLRKKVFHVTPKAPFDRSRTFPII